VEDATKWLVGQGVLGVACLILGFFNWIQWKENKNLTDRLEAKSEKHAEKNMETARQMTAAFESAIRSSENRTRTRRPTRAEKAVDE
jgi:hypothetical protein